MRRPSPLIGSACSNVIPVHYLPTSPAPQELAACLAGRASKVQVVALQPGEAFELKAAGA